MAKRLFGTDGVRGVAGKAPLDPPGVRKIGAALAEVLRSDGSPSCRVLLGMDTRESGPWIRDAVCCGLVSREASAVDAGVITTPGLAYLVTSHGFDAGVMISASHNPYRDNGLKVFGPDGIKLPDDREREIEALILDHAIADPGESGRRPDPDGTLKRDYVSHLEEVVRPVGGGFEKLKLVLDCANGSAAEIAPQVFRHHGATVRTLGDAPNGKNINLDCGSLHLDRLAAAVADGGFDAGLAFDGDADRCLGVDGKGRVVDGDHILFITGTRMKRAGTLRGDAIVATVMSNYWLEERLNAEGVLLHRAPVGDKYVLERMIDENLVLGGEQSGHVIFREYASTGDGVLTGLQLVDALLDERRTLNGIMDAIEPYPQLLLNVRVREKPELDRHPVVGPVVSEIESELHGRGRLVLRYSGTEPLARVMIEGKDEEAVKRHAERLATVIERELGV